MILGSKSKIDIGNSIKSRSVCGIIAMLHVK